MIESNRGRYGIVSAGDEMSVALKRSSDSAKNMPSQNGYRCCINQSHGPQFRLMQMNEIKADRVVEGSPLKRRSAEETAR